MEVHYTDNFVEACWGKNQDLGEIDWLDMVGEMCIEGEDMDLEAPC